MADHQTADPLQLLTVAEVAALLHVSPKTLYAWVAAGKFPALKLNGALRFRRHEVEAFLQRHGVSVAGESRHRPSPARVDDAVIRGIVRRVRRAVGA